MTGSDRDFPEVELSIPCNLLYVSVARQLIADLAARTGRLRQSKIDDLKLAVSEACSNSICAFEGKSLQEAALGTSSVDSALDCVTIRWSPSADSVTVRVSDCGPGFDPESAYLLGDPLETMSGRGIALIRALVDSALFESGPGGTTVTMVMEFPRSR